MDAAQRAAALKDVRRRMSECRKQYKGVKRISFMCRTQPGLEQGQAYSVAMSTLECERDRIIAAV